MLVEKIQRHIWKDYEELADNARYTPEYQQLYKSLHAPLLAPICHKPGSCLMHKPGSFFMIEIFCRTCFNKKRGDMCMARLTGISTPLGGVNWEYTDDDSSSPVMCIAALLESKRLLTMPYSRAGCCLPFESDAEYCIQSALQLKNTIPMILNSHKASPSVLVAINAVIHALNDFLNGATLLRDAPMILEQSNQQQKFQNMVRQLKEEVAQTMQPLLKDLFHGRSYFDQWRILNNSSES